MKAILFDLGRVLVHYDHQQTLAATAALAQVTVAEFHTWLRDFSQPMGVGDLDIEEFHAAFVARFDGDIGLAELVTAFAAGIQRDDAALAYALTLQQRPGVTVAIISNTNAVHVHWLDEQLPELREFDLVIMSNEVGLLKPDPAIFTTALELLEVEPGQALFIDDIAENVDAACRLGLAGIVHQDWTVTRPATEDWLAATS
ncbi:MAG: HAD-IA family hydrolase [Caldilineaceae bacterium]|nr:HAD-IA family hydrolase [Caldilineaceae bacterium]